MHYKKINKQRNQHSCYLSLLLLKLSILQNWLFFCFVLFFTVFCYVTGHVAKKLC